MILNYAAHPLIMDQTNGQKTTRHPLEPLKSAPEQPAGAERPGPGVCFFKNVRWVSPSFLTHAWYANINLAATCALGEQNMWKRPWSVMSSAALVGWVFRCSPSEVQPRGERTSLLPGWLDRLGETDWELKWSKMTGGCLWTTALVFVAACVKVSCLGLLDGYRVWVVIQRLEGRSVSSVRMTDFQINPVLINWERKLDPSSKLYMSYKGIVLIPQVYSGAINSNNEDGTYIKCHSRKL